MSLEDKVKKLQEDIIELRELSNTAQRHRVKDILYIELRKLETELVTLKEEQKKDSIAEGEAKAAGHAVARAPKQVYDVAIKNFSWDQSDKFVKIYVTGLKNVQTLTDDDIEKNITPYSVEVRVKNLDGKNHVFSIRETNDRLNPEKCYVKIKTDMIVIYLAKDEEKREWKHLKAVERLAEMQRSQVPPVDPGEDPSANLMKMMKKMYDEGDDDMKRTIAKAWTESREKQSNMDMV